MPDPLGYRNVVNSATERVHRGATGGGRGLALPARRAFGLGVSAGGGGRGVAAAPGTSAARGIRVAGGLRSPPPRRAVFGFASGGVLGGCPRVPLRRRAWFAGGLRRLVSGLRGSFVCRGCALRARLFFRGRPEPPAPGPPPPPARCAAGLPCVPSLIKKNTQKKGWPPGGPFRGWCLSAACRPGAPLPSAFARRFAPSAKRARMLRPISLGLFAPRSPRAGRLPGCAAFAQGPGPAPRGAATQVGEVKFLRVGVPSGLI